MDGLATARLDLVPLSAAQLEACLADQATAERALGVPLCPDTVTEPAREAIRVKLYRLEEAPPAELPWHTYFLMLLREEGVGVGLIGFKGTPTAQGLVEVGYGIAESYRNRGCTTEALRALIAWAFTQPGCTTIFADTDIANVASQRVLAKAGLRRCGEAHGMYLWRLDKPRSRP